MATKTSLALPTNPISFNDLNQEAFKHFLDETLVEQSNPRSSQPLLDAWIAKLKIKNDILLKQLNEKAADDRLFNTAAPSHPVEVVQEIDSLSPEEITKKFLLHHAGWIFTGVMATVALTTLTPIGAGLAFGAAKVPEFLGELCLNFGKSITELLLSEAAKELASSPWVFTMGKIAFIAASLYPLYRKTKDPISRAVKRGVQMTKNTLQVMEEHTILIFFIGYAIIYSGLKIFENQPLYKNYIYHT
ncbi:MAG: hypothetical protein HY861_02070 [Chlamydiia bacterium]|nr:hypothetical protein [Chlamydiia bacterium]